MSETVGRETAQGGAKPAKRETRRKAQARQAGKPAARAKEEGGK